MKVISEIWFSDLETTTFDSQFFKKNNDTRINLWTLMNLNGDKYFCGTDFAEYFSIIKNEIQKNCHVYYHNLSFDGDFILKWLAKNGFEAVNECDFAKPMQFCFFRSLSKIYAIKVSLPSGFKKPQIITFKCSYLLLSASIQKLGEGIGIEKYKNFDEKLYDLEPQNDISKYPTAYVEYAKRDTNIARLSFLNFDKEISNFLKKQPAHFKKFNWKDLYTIGSISYELQRLYILKNAKFKWSYKISLDDYLIADNFYFGGFTQFNPQIQNSAVKCKKGFSFDINSAHPFSMTKLLPISKIHNAKTEPIPKNKKVLEFLEIKVDRAFATQDKLPCLINWNKINKEFGVSFSPQRYVFELDKFTCYYLKEEWEILQHFYKFEGVKIINHYWTFADYPLKNFTEDLYKFKVFHKQNKNDAMEHCYKILLNSAYGKHATRIKFGDFYICKNKEEWESFQEEEVMTFRNKEYEILHSHFTFDIENVYAIPILKKADPKYLSNKLMAATITAWSRIYLLEGVLKLGLDNFLYCDTDSIYVSNVEKNIKIKLDDYELGAWKREQKVPFKYFYVQGAKCYVVADDKELKNPRKVTYSGVSKKWLKRNYDPGIYGSFDAPLEKANLKRLNCKSGLVIVPVDYQPKPRSI